MAVTCLSESAVNPKGNRSMQANTIILSVKDADGLNPSDKAFTRIKVDGNRSTYYEDGVHSSVNRSQLQLYRTDSKPSGNCVGTRKCAVKLTKDQSVPNRDGSGNNVLPCLCEVNFSIPEGTDKLNVAELRRTVIAALADNEIMDDLCELLEI